MDDKKYPFLISEREMKEWIAGCPAQVKKIRILGSAALTLCYIAAGRFDAYIENRIHLWDFAAARVILEAAGGCLEYEPSSADGRTGSVIAWNGALPIHDALKMN